MGDAGNKYFDLLTLLRMGDIDIRRVVRNNLSTRAVDYSNMLSNFENSAQIGTDAIKKIAALEGNESDIKNLESIMGMLEGIGCMNILPAFENTIMAGKRGHAAFASDCAKKLQADYNKLLVRIKAAKKAEKTVTAEGSADEDSLSYASYKSLPLKEVLPLLEQEEAVRKLRILAVDDAPVMIKTISSVLSNEYKVYGMTNPTMLEKFLEQIVPDLFLLDYQMPEINGFDLVPIIRNFQEHKDTPIIFLTSMGTVEHVSAATALGASDFIVKPFQGDYLREKVAKHIVRKKLPI